MNKKSFKIKNSKIGRIVISAVFAFFAFYFVSCGEDSGLGSSVDTEAPKITIDYPPTDAVIRESFVLGGSWSDDKNLKNISVEVFRMLSDETKTSVFKSDASVEKETWSINLNNYNEETYADYNGWQFCDGSYEVQVTAYDGAGHSSGTSSRSFSIDNTPPVLVITKPTVTGDATPKSYGRTVQLEGTFSEACAKKIAKLTVTFYDKNGSKLFDSEFENILEMSQSNPLVVAQYFDSDEEPAEGSVDFKKWENYKKLYSDENIQKYRDGSDLTEQFYFSVTATDGAKIYKDFTNKTSDSTGNTTKKFYRGTTEILQLFANGNSSFKDFSYESLRGFLNKTDRTYIDNAELNVSLTKILEAAQLESTNANDDAEKICQNYLTFSLNPRNNPTFTIGGLSLQGEISENENYTEGYPNYNSGTINISVVPGLDLTNIAKDSVSIYYTRIDENGGEGEKNLLWTWNQDVAVEYAKSFYNISDDEAKTAVSADPETYRYEKTESGENTDLLQKSTKLSAAAGEIIYGYKYKITAEGKDINGQTLLASEKTGFGFFAKSSAAAPKVSFDSEVKSEFKNLQTLTPVKESVVIGGNLSFSGTASSDSEIKKITYSVTVSDTSDSSKSAKIGNTVLWSANETEDHSYIAEWSFEFKPDAEIKNLVAKPGLYTVSVEVEAATSLDSTVSSEEKGAASRSYYLDNVAPQISNVLVSTAYTKDGTLYINNLQKFTLSGTSTDNYLLDSTKITFSGKSADGKEKTLSYESENISWSESEIDLSEFATREDSDVILTVTAKDKAGNVSSEEFKIEFDTTAPLAKHRFDKKNKDLIFRVGEFDNDLDELKSFDSNITALDSELDKDVGGKYSAGTWGNSQTITIRGDFTEDGSGLKMIYYKIFTSDEEDYAGPEEDELADFLKNYASAKDGFFAPLSEKFLRRVSYTKDNDSKSFAEIESSFKTTLSGFKAGSNYLALVAVDNVGNAALDELLALSFNDSDASEEEANSDWNKNLSVFSLNVDTESPVLSCTSHNGANFTNKVKTIAVSGTFEDNASGVSAVAVNLNGKSVSASLSESAWEAQIALEMLSSLENGKTYNVNATVTDWAGNSSSSTIFTLQVDTTSPTVKINTPVTSAKLNGIILMQGAVNYDDAAPEKFQLYYALSEPNAENKETKIENLKKIGDEITNTDEIYSWSLSNIDVKTLSAVTEDSPSTTMYFIPVVYDTAGNCTIYSESLNSNGQIEKSYKYTEGTNYFKYTVDQNADRPVLKLGNIDVSGTVLKSSTKAYGTISDDDGLDGLKLFYIKKSDYDSLTEGNKKAPVVSADGIVALNGWTQIELNTESWEIDSGKEGTDFAYYLYAIDAAGGRFGSVESAALSRMYVVNALTDKTNEKDENKGISFGADLNPPEIKSVEISHDGLAWKTSTETFGPGDKELYVRISVLETVGLKSDSEQDSGYAVPALSIGGTDVASSLKNVESNENLYTFTFAPVDLSALNISGSNTAKLIVEDKSGFTGQGTIGINYDNAAPEVKIISPTTSMSDAVTGAISVKGLVQDDYSSIKKLCWLIPKSDETYSTENGDWEEIAASTSWEIKFASGASDSTDSLIYYANAQNESGNVYKITETGSAGIFEVPIYFKVEDYVGNSAVITNCYVLVDKDGGKPNAWINTPEKAATTSGKVTVYGGASDNVSVGEVQIQIDANGDGLFTVEDYNLISTGADWTESEAKANLKIYGADTASDTNWYIACTGTNSWKTTIDTNLIAESAAGGKYLRMRVRAFDEESTPQTRDWTTDGYIVTIDNDVPVINEIKLVQYGTSGGESLSSGTPVTEREYISGMYISNVSVENNGTWYLKANVSDNVKVSSITFSDLTSTTTTVIPLGASDINGNDTATYELNLPLDTTRSGMIYCNITAKDNGSGETTKNIKINIDSTSPSMYTTGGSETTTSETLNNALRLKSLSAKIGTGDEDSFVVNSNAYFTFGDVVSEGGSGLKFIAFDFEREKTGGTDKRIYDPALSSESDANRIELDGTTIKRNDDGLVSLTLSGTTRSSEDSFESNEITDYIKKGKIRKGGLVKIAGNYATIASAADSKVTFTPTVSSAYTDVEVIFAQIVDHQLSESLKDDGTIMNDDGDGMIETIVQIGSGYQWTASVDSKNIPDGPVTINVVAMDNAGNLIKGSIKTNVANNRPRIAKVLLGTDLNGNGTYDYNASASLTTNQTSENHLSADSIKSMEGSPLGEFSYYSALSATNVAQSVVKIESQEFNVVEGFVVIPEFVGGNNGLGYVLNAADSASLEKVTGTVKGLVSQTDLISKTTSKNASYSLAKEIGEFGGVILTGNTVSGTGEKFYNFTFWDKTEETTQGKDSQYAVLSVPVNLKTTETNVPAPKITPFYWNSATDNSVYIKESGETSASIKGHIELEDDLSDTIKTEFNDTDSKKPKVSGKLKIKGIVYDDVRLSSISMSIFGSENTTVANYVSGVWNVESTLPTALRSFTIEDVDISQKGHTVSYEAVIDTEKLSGVVGTKQWITVGASDWQNNYVYTVGDNAKTGTSGSAAFTGGTESTSGKVQTKTNGTSDENERFDTGWTNCYNMDVVPYVTEIWTGLSEYSAENPSIYSRSSVGNYPVRVGETVKIYGWNFTASGNIVSINTSTETLDSSEKESSSSVSQGTRFISFPIDSSYSSGEISVKVAGISSLNNKNNNDAKLSDSDYENAYNRKPNGVNNNILNDNVVLDIWDFKTAASPVGSAANYVHMKVGPYLSDDSTNSGRIGFSFKNAIGYFNMPGYKSGNGGSSTTGKVDLYISTSVGKAYGRMWDDGGSSYYYGNASHNPTSLGTATDGYYVISLSSVNFSSGHKLGIILSEAEGDWTNQTGDIYVTQAGKYYIGTSPNASIPAKDNNSTLTATETYTTSTTNSASTIYSQTRFGTNYGGFNYNTFSFDKNGYTYGAAQCPDTSGQSGMSANLQFFSRAVADESNDYHGLNFNYYNVTNARRIENTSYYKNGVIYTDENRVQNPEMATYYDSTNSKTYVYLAYYDHGLDIVKFRIGSVGTDANTIDRALQDLDSSTSYRKSGKTGTITDSNGGEGGDSDKIAVKNSNLRDSTDSNYIGYQYVSKIATSGTSPYVAVGALPTNGTAVVVWYDKNTQSLNMKYAAFDSVTSDSVSWTDGGTISTVGGKYVSMATDEAGGIHLAYLSNSGANLYYTYLSSVSSTPITMLVDAYQDVGDRCMITVGRETSTGPWIPYISYKSNYASHTKIAYPVFGDSANNGTVASAGIADGTEKYTGMWNVSLVPDTSLSIDDTISVGVNKDWTSGIMYNFPSGETVTASDTGVYALCDATIVYGNGTKNPVMGYAIEDGTIQMAQKK